MTFSKVPKNPELNTLFEEANQLIKDERDVALIMEGLAVYDKLLEQEPDFGYGYFRRASALMVTGRLLEAIFDYEKAIELGVDTVDAYYNISVLARLKNDAPKCKKYLEYVMEKFPEKTQAVADYGNVLFDEQDFDGAVEYFKKALDLEVKDFAVYLRMGAYHMDHGNVDEAIELLTEAKLANPTQYIVYYYRGNCYYEQGKLEEALDDYDRCAFLDPNFPEVYYKQGCIYYELGEYDKAIERFSLMTSILPDSEVGYFHIALVAVEKGDFDLAIEQLEKSIEIYNQDANAYFLLAQAYMGKEDEEKAAEALAKAEELGFEVPAE